MDELKEYVDEDKLLEDYGGKDPYKFEYQTVKEREESNSGYIPPWEMAWATEWKKELNE